MNKNKSISLVFLLIFACLLTACGSENQENIVIETEDIKVIEEDIDISNESTIIDEELPPSIEEELPPGIEESDKELIKDELLDLNENSDKLIFYDLSDFSINLEDASISINSYFEDLKNSNLTLEDKYLNSSLSSNSYSIDIPHNYKDTESFIMVSYKNASLFDTSILDSEVLSIEIDILNSSEIPFTLFNKNIFQLTYEDVNQNLGESTFIYEGEDSTIYTYEDEEQNYLIFQFDKEYENLVYFKSIKK